MRPSLLLLVVAALLPSCTRGSNTKPHTEATAPAPTPAPSPAPTPPEPTPSPPLDPNCGMSPNDWCPAPAGDPCGAHHDTASCKADARCEGMAYHGESVVACMNGERCFATNCPTVGCISRCELLTESDCTSTANAKRCSWSGGACARRVACRPPS